MNKTELVAAIADKTELSKKDSEKALKAFIDVVGEELKKGEKIQLVGFGTFEVAERHTGKTPTEWLRGIAAVGHRFHRLGEYLCPCASVVKNSQRTV